MMKAQPRAALAGADVWLSTVTLVVVLMTACQAQVSPAASVSPSTTPSRDPAIVAYSTMVNTDTDLLDVQIYKKFACKTRVTCISELQDIHGVAEMLLRDLTNTPAPPALRQLGAALLVVAQQFIGQLEATLVAMQQPGSDYVRISAQPNVHPLDIAAGGVVCWPLKPIPVEGGENPSGYECG